MIGEILRFAIMCGVWIIPYAMPKREEKIKNLCAGFCTARAAAQLCGRCAWTYSVVFGELPGMLMLAVTAAGSIALFEMLSGERSDLILASVYTFFSAAESEYTAHDGSIINEAAEGVRMGLAGISEAGGKRTLLLCAMAAAGTAAGCFGAEMPAAFSAISCCALLVKGIRNISADRWCIVGASAACILSYL